MKPDRSAGFSTCCLADFKIGGALKVSGASNFQCRAGFETCDTADLESALRRTEVCAAKLIPDSANIL
jgi:hypothetical protein